MEHQHGGKLIEAAAEFGLDPAEIIDFSANINFLGPPPEITAGIKNNLQEIKNYPEINAKTLKKLIGSKHQIKPAKVVVGNGAAELLYQLTKVKEPQKVMVVNPTFSEYELAAESVKAEIINFQLKSENDFKLVLTDLKQNLNAKLDILFICNPNNPTAHLLKAAELKNLIAQAAELGILVVVDEAFIDFLKDEAQYSVLKYLAEFENLLILKSMTKLFAIPGLRLGYALTNQKLAEKMNQRRDPWSVNCFAQLAGKIIFSGDQKIAEYIKKSREKIAQEREYLYSSLNKFKDLKVYQPTTNYIFVDISAAPYNARQLKSALLKKVILIRNCESYPGLDANYIRLAVKDRSSNKILIENLATLLN